MSSNLPTYTNFAQQTDTQKFLLAQKLGTVKGFYEYYFNHLSKFKSQTECFNAVNLLHYKIFNEYKYSNYDSFRKIFIYHLKNNRR